LGLPFYFFINKLRLNLAAPETKNIYLKMITKKRFREYLGLIFLIFVVVCSFFPKSVKIGKFNQI
jgi:hypothetical protein